MSILFLKLIKPSERFFSLPVFCLLFLLLVSGCAGKVKQQSSTHFLMDTVIQIDVWGKDPEKNSQALRNAFQLMQQIANKTDRYQDSEISNLNGKAGLEAGQVSRETFEIISFALQKPHPEVDISLGPVVDLWQQGKANSTLPTEAQIKETLQYVGQENIQLDQSTQTVYLKEKKMSLDLGALAKGYAVEEAGRQLGADPSVQAALVNGGGNIKVVGEKPDKSLWRIGIQDPENTSDLIGVLNLNAGDGVATSGNYQRYFEFAGERYHHLLDPVTGWPAGHNISATAVCKDAFLADYYSTLLFILPAEKALTLAAQTEDLECILITKERRLLVSPGLKDRFERNEQANWIYQES